MKKILIVSSVLALAMLGVVSYLLFSDSGKRSGTAVEDVATSTVGTAPDSERVFGTGSLTSLMSGGRPLECTITYTSSGTTAPTQGTYFTAGGLLRGDFVVSGLATGSVSSLIVRDNTLYTWSVIEGESYGMKVDLATLAATKQSDTAPQTNEPVPLDAPVKYDCVPWSMIDNSVFAVPTDVLFTDYADVMNMGMEFGTIYEEAPTNTTTQCELCSRVKGEAGDACRAQFKCQDQ